MNRRKRPRFPVELRCSFVGDTFTGEGTVLDLSMEGCRMRCDMPLFPGAYVDVFIALVDEIPPLPIDLAVIRWSAGPIVGLEFIRIAEKHYARLRHQVQDLEQAHVAIVPPTSMRSGE